MDSETVPATRAARRRQAGAQGASGGSATRPAAGLSRGRAAQRPSLLKGLPGLLRHLVPRLSVPVLAACAVALLGALFVLFGGLRATVLAPPSTTSAVLLSPRQPVVSTAIGMLGLEGPRLEVDATSGTALSPVFIGIGRARDVDAYLAQVDRLELNGDDKGRLLTRKLGSEPAVPNPAAADVWVVSTRSAGAGSLVWPDAPGQWRMVIATDGANPAAGKITMTWSGRKHAAPGPALISIGLVLLVAGLITLVMLDSRSRLGDEQ